MSNSDRSRFESMSAGLAPWDIFLEEPIRRVKQKAAERGLTATFLVRDAVAREETTVALDV